MFLVICFHWRSKVIKWIKTFCVSFDEVGMRERLYLVIYIVTCIVIPQFGIK